MRDKLIAVIENAAKQENYAFYTGKEFRIAPELKQMPAVWLITPQLSEQRGVERGEAIYKIDMHIVKGHGRDGVEREKSWTMLESDAAKICERLAKHAEVKAVYDLKMEPHEINMTNRGEVSIKVSYAIELSFNRNNNS